MWDYSFAIPSLLILMIIMFFYFSLPRLPIKMNRVFLSIVLNEAVVIVLDIVSSLADENYRLFSVPFLIALNTAYFVFFIIRMYLYYIYTFVLLRINLPKKSILSIVDTIPLLISLSIIFAGMFTGYIFTIDDTGYHSGKLYNLIYVSNYFYLILSFILIYCFRDRIRRRRERRSIIGYNVLMAIGLMVRIALPKLLLFDTVCVMAVILIYLAFENPEFFIELRSGTFNSHAFRSYIEENEGKGKYRILAFVIKNYHEMREIYGSAQMDHGIALISNFLVKNYSDRMFFYYRSGRFIVVGKADMDYKRMQEELWVRFHLPWKSNNTELYLDIGFAVIDCSEGYEHAAEVISTIGKLLETADKSGDQVCEYADKTTMEEYEDDLKNKLALESAIDNERVEIFLQPIMHADSKNLAGAEALARIRDEEGNLISPGAFIPIAEKNGRISQLGEQVFEKVCKFLSENDIEKMNMSFINVNLSPIQFMRNDLCDRFLRIIRRYGIDAEKIHLEITEESMKDEQQMLRQIEMMQRAGFLFALDDYGKGYSNLTRLKRTPFINIKIDMEVVWDHCKNPDNVLPMMVRSFKDIGFTITAEGIETEEMADQMSEMGADLLQGKLFSMPIPVNEFIKKYS